MMVKGSDNAEILVYGVKDADGNNYGTFATKPGVGDTITVTGNIQNFYGAAEIVNGVLVSFEAHTCSFSEATCTLPATCALCGKTNGDANGHNYVSGVCTVCGGAEDAEEVTVSVVIADYADTNNWANGTKYTEIVIDENIKVTAAGGSNTAKYYTSGENWRIYQTESPSVTITAENGKTIVSVKITYAVKNTGCLTLNGENIASGTVVTVDAASVTFSVGNTGSATNGQAQITSIEVIYA